MQKTITGVTVKDAEKGTVSAVFSTFDVIDKDGDVTSKDAITDGAEVVISAYGHQSHYGALPVGKGIIRTTDTEAILEGQFFLDTAVGKDTFTTVKNLGPLGEWSYSLHDVKAHPGEFDGQQVNFLDSIFVKEVSPVLRGAGVNTRTLGVKSLHDQIAETVGAVTEAIDSADRVVALRAEKGKGLSNINAESLAGLMAQMDRLKTLLDAVTDDSSSAEATSFEDIEAMAVAYRRAELFSSLTQTGARS